MVVVSFGDSLVPPEAQLSIFLSRLIHWRQGVYFCLLKEDTGLGFSVPLSEGLLHPFTWRLGGL